MPQAGQLFGVRAPNTNAMVRARILDGMITLTAVSAGLQRTLRDPLQSKTSRTQEIKTSRSPRRGP